MTKKSSWGKKKSDRRFKKLPVWIYAGEQRSSLSLNPVGSSGRQCHLPSELLWFCSEKGDGCDPRVCLRFCVLPFTSTVKVGLTNLLPKTIVRILWNSLQETQRLAAYVVMEEVSSPGLCPAQWTMQSLCMTTGPQLSTSRWWSLQRKSQQREVSTEHGGHYLPCRGSSSSLNRKAADLSSQAYLSETNFITSGGCGRKNSS